MVFNYKLLARSCQRIHSADSSGIFEIALTVSLGNDATSNEHNDGLSSHHSTENRENKSTKRLRVFFDERLASI